MALSPEPLVLPFKGEKFSFALSYKTEEQPEAEIDLACICFDRECRPLDSVQFNNSSALKGAVKHSRDRGLPKDDAVEGDEAVHVYPWKLAPECEVMLFVASAPLLPVRRSDLGLTGNLALTISSREKGKPAEVNAQVDLSQLVADAKDGSSMLSNGHQSMIVAGLCSTPQGWSVMYVGSTYPQDNWGAMIPELKDAIRQWSFLTAAESCVVDPVEKVVLTRQYEDRSLYELTSAVEGSDVTSKVLRLDVGWQLWAKAEEEVEDCDVQFQLLMYNVQGEELGAVSADNMEAEGLLVAEPDPEPEEEEAQQEEEVAPHEQDEGEEGDNPEGVEGEAEAKPEEPEPEPPYRLSEPFPLKHKISIKLNEVPQGVRNIVLLVSNQAGSGFKLVKSVNVRLMDASADAANPRPVLDYRYDSAKGADADVTQLVMVKLYKEYNDSAFCVWRNSSTADVESFIAGADACSLLADVRGQQQQRISKEAEAKAKLEEEGDEETEVDLREVTWRTRALGLAYPGEGLEAIETEFKNVLNYEGKLSADGRRTDSAAKAVYPNKDTYFGGYDTDTKSSGGLYVFATGAVYLGQYANGRRDGLGAMALPDGGYYQGSFADDKFEGQGRYTYPDGCYYDGAWSKGLKHGSGTYWDAASGCLRGLWVNGVLKGPAQYDQPSYHFEGNFVKGVPAGECTFTLQAFRMLDLPKQAAAHILEPNGPTLSANGTYTIPAGSEYEPPQPAEGEEPTADDADRPAIPSFPKYEGLGFTSADEPPVSQPDISFPPQLVAV